MAVTLLFGTLSRNGINQSINQMDVYMDACTDQPVHAVCLFVLMDICTYVRTTVDWMDGFMYGCMYVQLFVGMDGYTGVCMHALHSWLG